MRRVTWSWDDAHEYEAIFSIDELVCYVFMPMRCQTLRNQNLEQLSGLKFCDAWRNNYHAEIMKFQDFSWNFSFQAVKRRRKILFTCDKATNAAVLEELNYI